MTTAPSPLDAASSVPLAVVERSGFPESQHQGAAVVVADGEVLVARGGVDRLVYPRSALKPFQTVAALRAGVELDARQRTVVTSSHDGSAEHVDVVRQVLSDAGLDESALQTPAAWPGSPAEAAELVRQGLGPSRIAMTCSGNHAGMLAAAVALGIDPATYLDPANRVHALAREVLEEHSGVAPAHPGTDGCGGPVWAVPLVAFARGYGSLFAAEPELAAAIRANPVLIEGLSDYAGTTAAVSDLGVVAKAGAEGVWCAVAPNGTAVAVKVLDGSPRAAAAVAVALLAEVGALDVDAVTAYLARPALTVHGGAAEVGRVRPLP